MEELFAGMIVSSFGLDGFDDETRNWNSLLALIFKDLLHLGQTATIFGLVFTHVLLQRIPNKTKQSKAS
jgi:hypothetical protein